MSLIARADSPSGNSDATAPATVDDHHCVYGSYWFSNKTPMLERLQLAMNAAANCRKQLEVVKREIDETLDNEKNRPYPNPDLIEAFLRDVIMPLLVSGKPSDETVRAVGLNDAVVMTEDAFIEAEGTLLQYMEAFIKQKSQQNKKATDNARSVAKAFLDEFSEIVMDSLWPEELAISRARQKTFKRSFHLRLFNAVDMFIKETVEAFVRNPQTKVLQGYFDHLADDVDIQMEDLIEALVNNITVHFNNSGSNAHEKKWANDLKEFVQKNAGVQVKQDDARNFFNYIKNKVLGLENTIKQEQEKELEPPPPSKASKSAKLRERKKRAAKNTNSSPAAPAAADGDNNEGPNRKRHKSA